jgi:hypothetical protein
MTESIPPEEQDKLSIGAFVYLKAIGIGLKDGKTIPQILEEIKNSQEGEFDEIKRTNFIDAVLAIIKHHPNKQ